MENKVKLETLAKWLEESKYTVILTGAGMSTESGIPDFRSKDGLWKKMDPMKLASTRTLMEDYNTFYEFYKMRIETLSKAKPHIGYNILAKWEVKGLINAVVTQNVDDFHLMAGNKNVYRLHGSLNEFSCSKCNSTARKEDFLEKLPCTKCGGKLRPNVVLFGESLPETTLYEAICQMKEAELVIVIGTSLAVFPVNQLPYITSGRKVYINKEIPIKNKFHIELESSAGEILQKVDKIL